MSYRPEQGEMKSVAAPNNTRIDYIFVGGQWLPFEPYDETHKRLSEEYSIRHNGCSNDSN